MRRKFAILPIAFVSFAALASCETAEERAERHLQSALSLAAEGDASRATVEFRNVFKLDPTHREARRAFAEMLEQQGNSGAALQQYLLIVEQYPDDAPATTKLAEIAVLMNQWEAAERYGRKASELAPDDARVALITLNLDYRKAILEGDAAARASLAQRADELTAGNPDERLLHRLTIDWYIFTGRERDALAVTDRAIAAAPDDIALYHTRIAILNALGETPEIESSLREMVRLFPEDTAIRQTLFRWLLSQGDIPAAEAFLRQMAESAEGSERLAGYVSLVQFIRSNRGAEAAVEELDALIAAQEENALFRALKSSIRFDLGARDEAIAAIEAIIAEEEETDQIRDIKAVLARMQIANGNLVGARALVEEVLAADATHVEAIKLKAGFLIEGDLASEAIVLLRSALEQSPEDPQLYSLTARAHERNGNRDLMGESLARAAEVSNRAPAETVTLARFLISRGQLGPAEQALVEALRNAPGNLQVLGELGQLYIRMEKPGEATRVEEALRAAGTERAVSLADQIRLSLLRLQNRNDDFVAMVEQLTEGSTDKGRSTVAIMRAHLANGKTDKAAEVVRQALAEAPDDLDLQFANAVLDSVTGDVGLARERFRAILEKEPRAVNVWLALSRSYGSTGDAAKAEAVIDEALAILPEHGNLRWIKAGHLERRGDIGGAIEIYEALYDAGSSSLIAANNLASLLTSYRESEEVVERAYAIARRLRGLEQPAFQDTYGWIAFLRGDLEDALSHMEPAAAGLPQDPLVQYHLARVYEALGRPADAAVAYERAIAVLGDRKNEAMQDAAERLAAVSAAAGDN